jgi:hypothetical protein
MLNRKVAIPICQSHWIQSKKCSAISKEPMTDIFPRNFALQNKALTPTHNFPISYRPGSALSPKRGHPFSPPSLIKSEDFFDISTAEGPLLSPNQVPTMAEATTSILIFTKMEVLAHLGNVPTGFINRTSWAPQNSSYKPLIEINRGVWDKNQLVPLITISKDERVKTWVDIVVNNLDEKGHPFHLVSTTSTDTRCFRFFIMNIKCITRTVTYTQST